MTAMPAQSQLEQLYDAHAVGLFHYLRGFVPQEADAKDLLQEFFMRLATRPVPPAVHNEKAWLWRMAHNLALDWLRRQGTRHMAHERLGGELDQSEPGQAASLPECGHDVAVLDRQVQAALAALPPEQRSVAFLKLWQGLTLEEIAQAQDLPLNTAASRYRYALEKLRTALQPLYREIQP